MTGTLTDTHVPFASTVLPNPELFGLIDAYIVCCSAPWPFLGQPAGLNPIVILSKIIWICALVCFECLCVLSALGVCMVWCILDICIVCGVQRLRRFLILGSFPHPLRLVRFLGFQKLGSSRVFCLLPLRPFLRSTGFLGFQNQGNLWFFVT